jgi:hypothetical protein
VLPNCTTGNAAPVGDTVMATLFGLPAAFLLPIGAGIMVDEAGPGGDSFNEDMGQLFLGLGLMYATLATPWILSARAGYRKHAVPAARRGVRLGVPS